MVVLWPLALVLTVVIVWAVFVWPRSRKRAAHDACIRCGKDLGHKSNSAVVETVLFSGDRGRLHAKEIRRVMCPSCAHATIYNYYLRHVIFAAIVVLIMGVFAFHWVSMAMTGVYDWQQLFGLGIILVNMLFVVSWAQDAKRALRTVARDIEKQRNRDKV
jgi:hypothetical protein